MNYKVKIIGAGLSGSEAAWQLARAGVEVELFEMRPNLMTRAHRTGLCAELVCSNSFRGNDLSNAVGLLKRELIELDSLIMEAALAAQVPAGGALAVDREVFSHYVHTKIHKHPQIQVIVGEVSEVPQAAPNAPVIVATGPLTSATLSSSIAQLTGEAHLAFYDAISPIILAESIDFTKTFRASRYGKGGGDDYLNLPLTREEYYRFVSDVTSAEKHSGHEEVENDEVLKPFEGCMPIEDMIERGPDTLLFGPFKPVGLVDPVSGKRPFAVVQLRQDDKAGKLWSMVGMQTRLKHGEQLRIFRTLPGLAQAEFVRLGSVHRNTFINSPACLEPTLQFRTRPGLFFAGQLTGVEGYVESTAGGLVAGLNAARLIRGEPLLTFPPNSAIGALLHYISDPERRDFQPMNISYGLMPSYLQSATRTEEGKRISKKDRRVNASLSALESVRQLVAENGKG